MANIVKVKLVVLAFSFTALTLIPQFESNFNAPVEINRWRQLSWSDFEGFVRPFTGWAAVISSSVYVEYDSLSQKYVAYAGQNNQQSWVKSSSKDSEYTLNHEQYHFNITEYHARLMNDFLTQFDSIDDASIVRKLSSIRSDLSAMQDEYDNQSDHSLIEDQQRRWEFKIDSLLKIHSDNPQPFVDYYSGGSIFFPVEPSYFTGKNENNSVYRLHELVKYDMVLALASFQFQDFGVESFRSDLVDNYEEDSIKIDLIRFDSTSIHSIRAFVSSKDTLNNYAYHHLWHYNEDYLYKVTARYPTTTADSIGYHEIAESFINSFEITDTQDYWISRFSQSSSTIVNTKIERTSAGDSNDDDNSTFCATYGEYDLYGFYKGPFYREDGGLMLIYNIIEEPDSLVYRNLFLYGEELFTYTLDSSDHILYIPANKLPQESIQADFGYLLKGDSTKKCYEFFYQTTTINPSDYQPEYFPSSDL